MDIDIRSINRGKTMSVQITIELQGLFEQVSQLVDRYQKHDPYFTDSVKMWLKQSEQILQMHGLPQLGELAGMRATIEAAQKGVRDSSFVVVERGVRSAKAAAAVASILLNRAQEHLQKILEPITHTLDEAEKIIRQIVVIAARFGIIDQLSDDDGGLNVSVEEFWRHLAARKDMGEWLMRVLSLISFEDALLLMKECLDDIPVEVYKKNLPGRNNTASAQLGAIIEDVRPEYMPEGN